MEHPNPQAPHAHPQHALAHAPHAQMARGGPGGTAHEITHGPSFAMLRVDLAPGQVVVAEAGSMVARHQHVHMEVKMNAGSSAGFFAKMKAFLIALVRKVVGGETFFVNHFSAPQPGSVWIAPKMSGQVHYRRMQGETITMSTGAYLASVGQLETKLKFGGLRSLLAKEGAFFLEIGGTGEVWFNSYGGIHAVPVNGTFLVDNGHLVAYEGNLKFDIRMAGGGMMGAMASGEGLLCEFQGQGTVYLQSRNVSALVGWLTKLL